MMHNVLIGNDWFGCDHMIHLVIRYSENLTDISCLLGWNSGLSKLKADVSQIYNAQPTKYKIRCVQVGARRCYLDSK